MEFSMLAPGDRCLVGFSGGKDSAFLLFALAALKEKAPFDFELAAATLDPMFDRDFPATKIEDLCASLGVPLFLERRNLAKLAFAPGKQNPCARCAFFRRGALNRIARRQGFNKLALAHHLDDALETFLVSIFYSGQLKTFTPVTHQDRSGITVIRPLIYLREGQIENADCFEWEPVPSGCPLDGHSARQKVKDLLARLALENADIYSNVLAAMRSSADERQLWPRPARREEMKGKYQAWRQ